MKATSYTVASHLAVLRGYVRRGGPEEWSQIIWSCLVIGICITELWEIYLN